MPADLQKLAQTIPVRRARPRRGLTTIVIVGLLVAAGIARANDGPADADLDQVAGGAAPAAAPPAAGTVDGVVAPAPDVPQPVLGTAGGLQVFVPAFVPVLVSYHEASFPEALPVSPRGRLTGNENPTRFTPPADDAAGAPYHVQVSRGRANGATSAIDVVMKPGDGVVAPVSGTVVEVRPYLLYGAYEDFRVEIRPDDDPSLAVVLIHVTDVAVQAGDHLEVGDLVAGGARLFPFDAVVDRQTAPTKYGHVHVEVKTAD